MNENDTQILATESGRILGLSADRVRQLADRGDLQARRTEGGVRLFNRADVEKLAAIREAARNGR